MLTSHCIPQAASEPKTVATNCRGGSPIEAARNEALRPSRLSNVVFTILLAATLFFTTVALAPKLAHAQSASLAGSQTTVNACTPGTRFDGYGIQFHLKVPDNSLPNFQSSSYIASLLNLAMMNVIEYCNKTAGNTPITQSSRFFATISTQSDGVVNAKKELGQDTWTINQNDTAIALQRVQQRAAQAQEQREMQARQNAEMQRQQAIQQQANAKLQTFVNSHGASGWAKFEVLTSNPFSVEGKVYLFNAKFAKMVSPSTAIFTSNNWGSGEIIVSDVPRTAFTQPTSVVFAGKVLGKTNTKNAMGGEISLPHVKYLGLACSAGDCDPYLKASLHFAP